MKLPRSSSKFQQCLKFFRDSIRSNQNTTRGFSLIEVLMAVLIMATGFLFITEALSRSQQAIRSSDYLIRASLLAEQKLAETEIHLRQYFGLSIGQDHGEEKSPNRTLAWKRQIQPYHNESMSDESKLHKVNFDMSWQEGSLRKGGLTMESLLMNRDKQGAGAGA